MFGNDDPTSTVESIYESVPPHTGSFNWADSRQTSVFNPFSPCRNNESNSSLPFSKPPGLFPYPKQNLFVAQQESEMFNFPQTEPLSTASELNLHEFTQSQLTSALLSSLSTPSADTTMKNILLLADILKAVTSSKASTEKTAIYPNPCLTGLDFNDHFPNVEQFFA
jgi:hypothetical protein